MVNYMVRRVLFAIVAIIGVSFVSFLVIEMAPGDFVSAYEMRLIQMGGLSAAEAEKAGEVVRARYGLTGPLPERYFQWAKAIVTKGDFGPAMAYGGKEVTELIVERLPRTLVIAILAHAISSVVGIGIGIYVAPRQYSLSDNLAALAAFFMTSAPRFALALIMMYWLVFGMGQQHVSSFHSPQYVLAPWSWDKLVDFVMHIWPVVLIAGLGGVAANMRIMRGNLLDVLNAQYVTTARSKGLRESRVMNKHAVPNALHPIIMYQGTVLPYMLQGEIEVAIVMSIPTLGPLFYNSLVQQDIYITGALLLIYSVLLVVGNLIADVALAILDPRIRYA
jgi:peptide/nickel transport system permease protein